jgi:hypothetical protein
VVRMSDEYYDAVEEEEENLKRLKSWLEEPN